MGNIKYFLAANSAEGFFYEFPRCYDPLDGWKAYIIKGGPGTGKSSFMKSVIKKAEKKGIEVEVVYCTGDPDSLDAVILPELKKVIMDGTSPHVVDPVFPGVGDQILNFGEFWNENALQSNKDEIIRTTKENKVLHRIAAKYICAAGRVTEAVLDTTAPFVDAKKCVACTEAITEKYLQGLDDIKATEKVRYLGGVTPKGTVYFTDWAVNLAENVVLVNDPYGTAASKVISKVKETALKKGYDVITFKNPVLPLQLLDGILIPSVSLLVLRVYSFVKCDTAAQNIGVDELYSERFEMYDKQSVIESQRTADDLLNIASKTLKQAKCVHDEIEKHYVSAMNFEALKAFGDKFCDQLFDI